MSKLDDMRAVIGANIKALRQVNGLTQKQLADMVGTHDSHISHWERGSREPELTTVFKLCLALDCELEDLLGISAEWKEWVR